MMQTPGNNGHQQGQFIRVSDGSLRDICHVLFRQKWVIFSFFVLIAGAVGLHTWRTRNTYQSDARVLIKLGRESVSLDPSVVGRTISVAQNRTSEVNSELLILMSRNLVEKVVDKIGPEAILRKPQRAGASLAAAQEADVEGGSARAGAIDLLTKNLELEVAKDSNVINLSLRTLDPQVSQKVLDSLLDLYLERHIEVHRSQVSPEFFQQQTSQLEKTLSKREEELQAFCEKYKITSLDKQKELNLAEIDNLQKSLLEIDTQVKASREKVAFLETTLKKRAKNQRLSETSRTMPSTFIDTEKKNLLDMKAKEADLAQRYPADDPTLQSLRDQIKVMEATLAKEGNSFVQVETIVGLDTLYKEFELTLQTERKDLLAEEARRGDVAVELERRQQDLKELTDHEMLLKRYQRQVEIAEKEYIEYRNNLQQSQISAALDRDKVSNVSIIQRATLPALPVGLNKNRKALLGLFLGFFGGIALAFFREHLDHSLKSSEDVEKRLGLPALITLSPEEFNSCI